MNPTFILVASTTAKLCRVLVGKITKKCHFFTFFGVTRQNFLGSRSNISTNEPVLERLLNFKIFGTYFKLIAHLVRAGEPPKAKKTKIRVTRKPDLETQNWVYSFSSFIEPYQTHIVTAQMLFDCWTVLISEWGADHSVELPCISTAANLKIINFIAIRHTIFSQFLLKFSENSLYFHPHFL